MTGRLGPAHQGMYDARQDFDREGGSGAGIMRESASGGNEGAVPTGLRRATATMAWRAEPRLALSEAKTT